MLKILLILVVGYVVVRMLPSRWLNHEERLRRKYWRRWLASPDHHRMRDECIDANFDEKQRERERRE